MTFSHFSPNPAFPKGSETGPIQGLPSSTLQKAQGFSQFVRHVSPDPLPTPREFYWQEFISHYQDSKQAGTQRYIDNLKKDQHARTKAALLSITVGVGMTAFRRLKRTYLYTLMMGLMAYPIIEANRTFPKLSQAYEQVKQGNPTEGRQTFRKAMNDSVYSILVDFLKPISYGLALAFALGIPSALRGQGDSLVSRLIRAGGKLLHINADFGPVRLIDKLARPITNKGDALCNRIRRKISPLNWIERT